MPGWSIDVDTEQSWLCLSVSRTGAGGRDREPHETELADTLMNIAGQQANHRLVVEFADGLLFSSLLVGQLVVLHKRVHLSGGSLRLCGLSDFNRETLRLMGVMDRFVLFTDRAAAVTA